MPGLLATSALAFGAAGMAAGIPMDMAIDRNGHDHDAPVYKMASMPTRVLSIGGGAMVAAGLGAMLIPGARAVAPTLLKLGAGALIGWAATFGTRLAMGMTIDARNGGRFDPSDIARNAVDRTHMMGNEYDLFPAEWRIMDAISRIQGHGGYHERMERGDFVPIWKPGDPPPGL